MALSVGTIQHEEVVSGHDASTIHVLGQAANPLGCYLTLLRLFPVWLGRFFLARRDSNALLPPYAVFRQQSSASEARPSRGGRLQPKHLVAGSASSHSLGRKLARQSPCEAGVRMLQPSLVAGRHRMVCDSLAGSRGTCEQHTAVTFPMKTEK